MANQPGQAVQGIAQEMGGDDGALTWDEACEHVVGNKLKGPLFKPIATFRDAGDVSVGDWPLKFINKHGGKLEQFCDVVLCHEIKVDREFFDDTLHKLCAQGRYNELPEAFRLKKEPGVPYTMQIIIVPCAAPDGPCDGELADKTHHHIVKHVYLHKNKLFAKQCLEMCFGVGNVVEWGGYNRNGLLAFNYMMDRSGGKQIRYWTVQPKFEKKQTQDQTSRADGYKFIRDKGPRSNNMNQFMEWTDEWVNTVGSKIENWNEGKVKEALSNYSRGRQNAKTLEYWPLTLKSFVAWFLNDILVHMLGSLRQHSITWIGRTRVGKSLGSKTILFAQSKYEIEIDERVDLIPSIVTAKHLDFFKAEPITKYKPGCFDDGLMQKQDASFLKAFLNPSEEDATVWARYTSAQFDQGANRQACNNPYDRDVDDRLYKKMKDTASFEVPVEDFLPLIQPSFAGVGERDDMDAVLARTHLIVLTLHGVYWRLASPDLNTVKIVEWPAGSAHDLLAPEYKPTFLAYKKNPHERQLPPSFHEDSVWSQALLKRLIAGEPVPPTATIFNANWFSVGRSDAIQLVPPLMTNDETRVKVKMEKKAAFFKLHKSRGVIDLGSPTPEKKKQRMDLGLTTPDRNSASASSSSVGPTADPIIAATTNLSSSSIPRTGPIVCPPNPDFHELAAGGDGAGGDPDDDDDDDAFPSIGEVDRDVMMEVEELPQDAWPGGPEAGE
jgi:hypothetical protein